MKFGILHSHQRENLKSYTALTGWALQQRRNVSPVRYELGFYTPVDDILQSHRREHLTSYSILHCYRRENIPADSGFRSLIKIGLTGLSFAVGIHRCANSLEAA
jgi:hypothetical protein